MASGGVNARITPCKYGISRSRSASFNAQVSRSAIALFSRWVACSSDRSYGERRGARRTGLDLRFGFIRHQVSEAVHHRDEQAVFHPLLDRQPVIGHEARMLFLGRIFDRPITPTLARFLGKPVLVGRGWACAGILEMEQDTIPGTDFLPFRSVPPRRL